MKILLADDHALFREGMRYVLCQLDAHVEILDASNFSEGLSIAENTPDLNLALLDLNMPGSNGAASVNLFHLRYPDIPVVVISGADQYDDIANVMNSGAMGFISKASNSNEMLHALHVVLDGGTYLPPQMLQVVAGEERKKDGRNYRTNKFGLTARQMEILKYLGLGMTNKTISETIGLAEGTIKVHVASVFQNLRVNNRIEAVQEARRRGLLADAEPS